MEASRTLTTGLTFQERIYPTPLRMKMHQDDVAQVILLLDGKIEHGSPGEPSREILPSTLTFLPQHAPHATRFQPGGVRSFELLAFPRFTSRLEEAGVVFKEQQIHTSGATVSLMRQLYQEFRRPDALTPLLLEGLTLELFGALGRAGRAGGAIESALPPRWLRTAQEFLQVHFRQNLSLQQVADAAGVHPSHLARGFRQHYRCTVGEYVRRLRIEQACRALTKSNPPLSELALELGFADQGHFSRVFKQQLGVTPGTFRKHATLR